MFVNKRYNLAEFIDGGADFEENSSWVFVDMGGNVDSL